MADKKQAQEKADDQAKAQPSVPSQEPPQDDALKWLEMSRIQVVLTHKQRQTMSALHRFLALCTSSEKPITATVVFAALYDAACERFVERGILSEQRELTTLEQLEEGKAVLDALAAQEAAAMSETPADGNAAGAAQQSETEFQPLAWEARHPGSCVSCSTPYDRRAKVTRIGEKEYLGLDCCDVGRDAAAALASS